MNANELADQLESKFIRGSHKQKAADMLRQQHAEIETLKFHGYRTQYELLRIKCIEQQAEIETLKQIIDANNLSQNIGQFVKPANKPVAWAREDGVIAFHEKTEVDSQGFKWFPLYTHPVKELTDEEIQEISHGFGEIAWLGDTTYEFARAILRKAQEK